MRLLFFKSARIPQALLLGLLLALLGCGGGGDSAGSTAPDVTTPAAGSIPNSGSFALLVKVELKTVVVKCQAAFKPNIHTHFNKRYNDASILTNRPLTLRTHA